MQLSYDTSTYVNMEACFDIVTHGTCDLQIMATENALGQLEGCAYFIFTASLLKLALPLSFQKEIICMHFLELF